MASKSKTPSSRPNRKAGQPPTGSSSRPESVSQSTSQPQSPPQPLRIVMISPECVPLAKTGGLADVVGALPIALKRM
ncbi:MAG: glycogen/starch synthase, partial [Candidatus Delongbacteria bacterium]|nr:glycogen/starch synthase [Candidatus Delongbacteria bacterium]